MEKEPPKFVFRGFRKPNYTPVPDELFDDLLPFLSGAELKALLYIIRKTFGWKKDSDNISISQMLHGVERSNGEVLDHGVGLTKKTLLAALNSLEDKRIIVTQRRQSRERGWEPTTYRLNVGGIPLGEESTPTLAEKLLQGPGAEIPPRAWGKKYAIQETTRQETGENTRPVFESKGISLSNFRNGDTRISGTKGKERGESLTSRQATQPQGQEEPLAEVSPRLQRGVETAAAVLKQRYERQRQAPSEARQAIGAYIHDFALELGDQAPLRSTVTRAVRLYEESGFSIGDFISCLHAARSVVKEYSGNIRKGRGEQTTGWKPTNKVPYFFAVLEDQLRLREHPDEEPTPAQENQLQREPSAWRTSTSGRRSDRQTKRSIGGPLVRVVSHSTWAEERTSSAGRGPSRGTSPAAQKRAKSGGSAPGGSDGSP